jgi:hypothetical protein
MVHLLVEVVRQLVRVLAAKQLEPLRLLMWWEDLKATTKGDDVAQLRALLPVSNCCSFFLIQIAKEDCLFVRQLVQPKLHD